MASEPSAFSCWSVSLAAGPSLDTAVAAVGSSLCQVKVTAELAPSSAFRADQQWMLEGILLPARLLSQAWLSGAD